VASADAGAAIDDLADRLGRLLTRAADELAGLDPRGRDIAARTSSWLDESRAITHAIPAVGESLLRAEEGRRLNVRAVGRPDAGPGLRQGLEAVEHSAVALRSMFRAIHDATGDPGWPQDEVGEAMAANLDQVLRELAAGVFAFGDLVRAEADPEHPDVLPEIHRVQAALDGLHEARARLEELSMTDVGPVAMELNAGVLATIKRLLAEMDLGGRVRRQLRLRHVSRPRHPRRDGPLAPGPGSPGPPVPPEEEPTQEFRLP
jgi:hypothetical protein